MRIGYACQVMGVPGAELKSCTKRTATPQRLTELIAQNLDALEVMLDYNIRTGIKMFRISSDIVPFGSSPVNTLAWREMFAGRLAGLGEKAVANGMRLSMHPGQYTVLNSPDEGVVSRAVEDLAYHAGFLDSMHLGPEHKLILHIGGIYGDKSGAVERFCRNYRLLGENIKARLAIENDDKLYTAEDVLAIGLREGIPVVFDNLHHQVNGSGAEELPYWIDACKATWRPQDGPQKTHCSQQAAGKRRGSHSATIEIAAFLDYYRELSDRDLDIMLEVKDKNLSAVKCINCTLASPRVKWLEREWGRYKYTVLERSPRHYQEIRALLKDKAAYPAREFYLLLQQALEEPVTTGHAVNAAQHVWGYFKEAATDRERTRFQKLLEVDGDGQLSLVRIKGFLHRLAKAHHCAYLLDSYYFIL